MLWIIIIELRSTIKRARGSTNNWLHWIINTDGKDTALRVSWRKYFSVTWTAAESKDCVVLLAYTYAPYLKQIQIYYLLEENKRETNQSSQLYKYQIILGHHLEISDSFSSFPLSVTNSITAWIAPSADCLILSHIAPEQTCRAATSCTIDWQQHEVLSKVFNYPCPWKLFIGTDRSIPHP